MTKNLWTDIKRFPKHLFRGALVGGAIGGLTSAIVSLSAGNSLSDKLYGDIAVGAYIGLCTDTFQYFIRSRIKQIKS